MLTQTPSIAPWLTVAEPAAAVTFYKKAFNASETYRLEFPEGLVVRLAVGNSEFWISGPEPVTNVGGGTVRIILTVPDPDVVFPRAIAAGAKAVFPVGDAHGWRLGRLEDPNGLHWEIGHPL